MLKKFSCLLICLLLGACASSEKPVVKSGISSEGADLNQLFVSNQQGDGTFRVGMLLPLSGKAAKLGKGLKKASMMALDDVKNPDLILQFYDTKGSPEGARTAVQNALSQNARLIIGPLSREEVQAISDETVYNDVPVIAFSTAKEVLRPKVYTLGLLIDEQVNRILSYAAEKGRSRFALLLPDNKMGIAVAKAAIASATQNNVEVVKIAFYPPETTNFANIVKQLTDYSTRNANLNRLKINLTALAENGDKSAERQLKQLKTTNSMGEVGFDAVIIPEYGSKLKSIISMFGYYDVYAPEVKFLGTSIWENSSLNKESIIINSWYPALSRYQSVYFSNKFSYLFDERPSSLYSFAYDAVALASALSKQTGIIDLNQAITNPDGYIGINGTFRLFENGSNQHSLDIMEVRANGDVVIDEAPKRFSNQETDYFNRRYINNYATSRPQIFGKPQTEAENLIFGTPVYEAINNSIEE